jgi:hypothetical protein
VFSYNREYYERRPADQPPPGVLVSEANEGSTDERSESIGVLPSKARHGSEELRSSGVLPNEVRQGSGDERQRVFWCLGGRSEPGLKARLKGVLRRLREYSERRLVMSTAKRRWTDRARVAWRRSGHGLGGRAKPGHPVGVLPSVARQGSSDLRSDGVLANEVRQGRPKDASRFRRLGRRPESSGASTTASEHNERAKRAASRGPGETAKPSR